MLVLLDATGSATDADGVVAAASGLGYHAVAVGRPGKLAVAITGGTSKPPSAPFEALPHVRAVVDAPNPWYLASREYEAADTVVDVAGIAVGGPRIVIVAGPCAVESEDQLFRTAELVKKSGIEMLRAGAYKLRTSPWAFQGLGAKGIDLLARVKAATGLRIVTEVVSETTL